jgi:diguanylate cyclase
VSSEYSDSLQEAARIARAAIPMANELVLPANPINYAVFYEYVAGQNQRLRAALDQFRDSSKTLTDSQMHSLYLSYVSDTDEQALKDVRLALSNIIDSTRGSLEKVAEESRTYQEDLGAAAKQLTSGGAGVVDIVAELIDETVRMQATSRDLENELTRTNRDLSSLRSDFKRVQEESLLDVLTGIQNRRAFDTALEEMLEHARANDEPVCLLLVDIDHFKTVNDTHGHVVGDAVLKQVANAINDTVRGGDVLARFGGEEFVVLLPDTALEGAECVADNICNKVRNTHMDQSRVGKDIGKITVSVGVALFHAQESNEAFLVRADTALYRAKESGRNRVCTHAVE